MSICGDLPHLRCQIKVGRLTNFNLELGGSLFVRYFLLAGDGRRIRVETSEALLGSCPPSWDQTAAVDCWGGSEKLLEPHGVAFELRWRKPSVLGRLGAGGGSKLLGRAEVAWKEVLAAPGRELKRCVGFGWLSSEFGGAKPPSLAVEMSVVGPVDAAEKKMSSSRGRRRRVQAVECGCRSSEWFGSEEDVALAAATMNAW